MRLALHPEFLLPENDYCIQDMRDNALSLVPQGNYCHGKTRSDKCPFWDLDNDAPEQLNGYCHLLKESDVEIDAFNRSTCARFDPSTGTLIPDADCPFPLSLIWEQCKECDINYYDDEEE